MDSNFGNLRALMQVQARIINSLNFENFFFLFGTGDFMKKFPLATCALRDR